MSLYRVLENWSDYDNKKIRTGIEAHLFSCDEIWEVNYLKGKIKESYPYLNDGKILEAIEACCRQVSAPRPRKIFVECVLSRLQLF